jgi:hypothetical protein
VEAHCDHERRALIPLAEQRACGRVETGMRRNFGQVRSAGMEEKAHPDG